MDITKTRAVHELWTGSAPKFEAPSRSWWIS